jgi:hypothetical protein
MAHKREVKRQPATTDDGREKQVISMAIDLAEKQIAAGTASSQVITHFLKLGSTRERLEQERLHRENLLLDAKVEQMQNAARIEELYAGAIEAMRVYSGKPVEEAEVEFYDED